HELTQEEIEKLKPFSNTSKYGQYFGKHSYIESLKVCILCHMCVPSKTGNTASMKAHLKNKHQVNKPQKNVISHNTLMKYLAQ
ncbi:MAG: hypothetical protein MHPSP_004916, partial [Paramarteilia canceri]